MKIARTRTETEIAEALAKEVLDGDRPLADDVVEWLMHHQALAYRGSGGDGHGPFGKHLGPVSGEMLEGVLRTVRFAAEASYARDTVRALEEMSRSPDDPTVERSKLTHELFRARDRLEQVLAAD